MASKHAAADCGRGMCDILAGGHQQADLVEVWVLVEVLGGTTGVIFSHLCCCCCHPHVIIKPATQSDVLASSICSPVEFITLTWSPLSGSPGQPHCASICQRVQACLQPPLRLHGCGEMGSCPSLSQRSTSASVYCQGCKPVCN